MRQSRNTGVMQRLPCFLCTLDKILHKLCSIPFRPSAALYDQYIFHMTCFLSFICTDTVSSINNITLILPQYKFRNPLVIPHDDPFHFRLPSVAELIPYAIPDSCAAMEAMDDADPVYACFGMIKIFPYFFNR